MKKYLFFPVLFITILLLIKPNASLASFPDVIQDSWYTNHIETLADLGYIKGYADGRFGPHDSITREQGVRILGRWLVNNGAYIPEDAVLVKRFYDIPLTKDREILQLTSLMAEEGIILGSAGKFDTDANMTRGQIALLLKRTIQFLYNINIEEEMKKANFQSAITDIESEYDELKQAIKALEFYNLTNNKTFLPNQSITRAEFATFLHRTMLQFEQEEIVLYPTPSEEVIDSGVYTLPAGTKLYSSPTMKRSILQLIDSNSFHLYVDETNRLLYTFIGNKRVYVDADREWQALQEIPSSTNERIGKVRLPKGVQLYSDKQFVRAAMTLEVETAFDVKSVENGVAVIQADGLTLYAKWNERKLYAQLPYKMLYTTSLLSQQSQLQSKGSIDRGVTLLANSISQDYIYVKDAFDMYAVQADSLIEVDELDHYPTKQATLTLPIHFKEYALLSTLDGKAVGTINPGYQFYLTGTEGNNGYGSYAGIPVQFSLDAIYHSNLVNSHQTISYDQMVSNLKQFHAMYPSFTSLEVIGNTVEGRAIYALKLGTGKREIVMDASIHAREYLTTNVLMEMIDTYAEAYAKGANLYGYNVRNVLDTTSIWFIPMVNADGVSLVQNGVYSTSYQDSVMKQNGGTNVQRWKANIRGVDLNRNFDGNWKDAATVSGPNWYNFKGYSVFSEPESQALRAFFAKHDFKAYISYHSSGNLLYYFHHQPPANEARDIAFARKISAVTNYYIMPPQYRKGSGSSADWFIMTYGKPGITMEISPYVGDRPVPMSHFTDIWNRNRSIGLLSAKESENF